MSEQDALIEEATRWLVLIHSGQASVEEQRSFRDWRAREQHHEQVCRRLEERLGILQVPASRGLDAERVRRLLNAPRSRRSLLRHTLAFGGLALGAGLVAQRFVPLEALNADLRTGTGERRTVALEDGSQMILNARSAVDIRYTREQRRLHLHEGELLVHVANAGERPFVASTPFGEASVHGRDLLLRHGDSSQAFSLHAPLSLRTFTGSRLDLAIGQQVRFDQHAFGPVTPSQGTESAWIDGLLEARGRSLSEVIDALRPYRRGFIRVDPRVAELKVSGLFRLDDSDQVLDALARTLPVRIERLTAFWITISAA